MEAHFIVSPLFISKAVNHSKNIKMSSNNRNNIHVGAEVKIVLKKDQSSGKLTEGIVEKILTSSPTHPHGIKVRLDTGEVGRVKEVI